MSSAGYEPVNAYVIEGQVVTRELRLSMSTGRMLRRLLTVIESSALVDKRFSIETDEREDKRTSLQEAVCRLVKPRMTLHESCAGTMPLGVGYEIIRQFTGRKRAQLRQKCLLPLAADSSSRCRKHC